MLIGSLAAARPTDRPPGPWRRYPSSPEGWGVKSPPCLPWRKVSTTYANSSLRNKWWKCKYIFAFRHFQLLMGYIYHFSKGCVCTKHSFNHPGCVYNQKCIFHPKGCVYNIASLSWLCTKPKTTLSLLKIDISVTSITEPMTYLLKRNGLP